MLLKRVPDGGDILRWSDLPLDEIDGGPTEQVDVFRVRTLPNGVDEILRFLPHQKPLPS